MPAPLLGPNWLQDKVLEICDGYATGKISTKDDKPLTPTVIAKLVFDKAPPAKKALMGEKPPSSGAVNAIFDRWDDYGVAVFTTKPRAFKAWKKGKPDLAAIRKQRSEARSKARGTTTAKATPAKKAGKKAASKPKAAAKA